MIFRDRTHAGRLLGGRLESYRTERPIILGLTRGGVPVAAEVARLLDAELDVMVVRKIGAPGSPEYAVGAIAEGGAVFVSPEALRDVGADDQWLAEVAAREGAELARRTHAYRGDRPMRDLAGRTVIVVDDGVATGATARAAGRAARQRGAARVVLAAPVIAAASEPELRSEFDAIVAVESPEVFFAVGQWYERFEQISDEDVVECLHRASAPNGARDLERVAAWPSDPQEETLTIPFDDARSGPGELDADLVLPAGAKGLVMFVHGSGSTRRSPRNRFVARTMQDARLATLLFDLLTPDEAAEDAITGQLRFDIRLLTGRVLAASRWISDFPGTRALRLCYFGASTGAAAALAAAAAMPEQIAAVVSRGGRPDLVEPATLRKVRAPVLLVVGGKDEAVLRLSRAVLQRLAAGELAVVPGASHLFEEPGALGAVAGLAARWFERHLPARVVAGAPPLA
jgi:putative phosphoribosyl transferase